MENLARRLEKRGWGKKDIGEAAWLIRKTKESIDSESALFQKRIYRILLVLIVVTNFAVAAALMPLLVALRGPFLYVVLAVIGASFGLLLELVIRSMEHLEKRHHLALALFMPIAAVANGFIISIISNSASRNLSLDNAHNPLAISIAYAAAFALPYIFYRFVLKVGYYLRE